MLQLRRKQLEEKEIKKRPKLYKSLGRIIIRGTT